MTTTIIESIDKIYQQTSKSNYKTLEQAHKDFESKLKPISELLKINDLETLFLIAILINNTEYKSCQLEDIAERLGISRFEIIKNIEILTSLQTKQLIEMREPELPNPERKSYISGNRYPIEFLNKNFVISKIVENKILNI